MSGYDFSCDAVPAVPSTSIRIHDPSAGVRVGGCDRLPVASSYYTYMQDYCKT